MLQEFSYFACPEHSTIANSSEDLQLRLSDGFEWLPGQGDLNIKIVMKHQSPPRDAAELTGLNVLWSPCCGAQTHTSFGHFLLQNWFPIFRVLQDLDVLSHSFQMLVEKVPGEHSLTLFQHYFGVFTMKPPRLWPQVLSETLASQKRWIRFCEVVIGAGGYVINMAQQQMMIEREYAHLIGPPSAINNGDVKLSAGTSHAWAEFRDFAMDGAGIKKNNQSNIFTIVLNDKVGDRRRIANIEEVEECLSKLSPQDVFEGAREWPVGFQISVTRVNFRALNVTEQMRILAHTSLFITTQGSSAFRWVFLPSGSAAIVLGAPEGGESLRYPAFYEIGAWFPISHIRFYKYKTRQENPSDYILEAGQEFWDANIKPQCSKLRVKVLQAIKEYVLDRHVPAWGDRRADT